MHHLLTGNIFTTIALMLILSFFVAYCLDFIMQRHGFGIWGNMLIINIQFPLGFWLSKSYFSGFLSTNEHMLLAVSATSITLIFMATIKATCFKI